MERGDKECSKRTKEIIKNDEKRRKVIRNVIKE